MRQFLVALALALVAGNAQAVTLVVGGGNWTGTADVRAGGTYYDAAFADGTCIGWFDGCDDLSVFVFTDSSSGFLAAQAILDQVLLQNTGGLFHSEPQLRNGCAYSSFSSICDVDMPIPPRSADLHAVSSASNLQTLDSRTPRNAVLQPK